ncbi:hypothetical protein C0989_012334 [Termitomyces sp. Mn162]|nr:hypothetical protein C0989_012334 [Termitomyces sp. Mn162]
MAVLSDEVKREIGQHFVFGFHGHQVSEDIKTLIRDYYLGNVILMKRNVLDAKQVRNIVRELQSIAKESGHEKPLLIGIDQENGAMALAATGNPDIAYQVSAATAKELKMVGINWVYSPVADVYVPTETVWEPSVSQEDDETHPHIAESKEVTRYASSVARGLTSCGIAPSAKHFPGHGDTYVDSHLALPVIRKTRSQLEATELVPFNALIHGTPPIASVMIGHMALPDLTGDNTPASLCPKITNELLRNQMGYDGVVVTDCLEMDAIAEPLQGGCGVEEGALRSLLAGADVAMVCHTFERHVGSINRVYAAVENGELPYGELVTSGRRIAKMKDEFAGNWGDVLVRETEETFQKEWNELKKMNMELSRTAYQKSLAVVWGTEKLPLKVEKKKKLLLFTPTMESLNRAVDDPEGVLRDRLGRLRNTAGASYLGLASEVQKRVTTMRHIVYSSHEDVDKNIISDARAIVFVLRNADRSIWQKHYLRKVLTQSKDIPVILLASCGPYDLAGAEDLHEKTVFIATFEFTRNAFEAFVEVAFDGNEAQGCMPVSI